MIELNFSLIFLIRQIRQNSTWLCADYDVSRNVIRLDTDDDDDIVNDDAWNDSVADNWWWW